MKSKQLFFGLFAFAFCLGEALQGSTWFAYVCDGGRGDGFVNIFDIAADAPASDSPIIINSTDPVSIAITPNGRTAYVIQEVNGTLLPIDIATNQPQTPIPLPVGSFATQVAITPDGTTAFVSSDTSPPQLFKIDLSTRAITTLNYGDGFDSGGGLAITPDGTKVYITNHANNNIAIVDVASFTLDPASPISDVNFSDPFLIAMRPNGQEALVLNAGSTIVNVIDLVGNTVTDNITIPDLADAIAITPNGTLAYIALEFENVVIPIDLATNTIRTPILLPLADNSPDGIAFTPDGNMAFVSNFSSNTLTRIDGVKSNTPVVTSTPLMGIFGFALAITPDQAPTARFTFKAAKPGLASTFDASASTPAQASIPIATYTWNFGDQSSVVITTTPLITHVFKKAGKYSVTLIITNIAGTSIFQTFTGQTVSNNGGPSALLTQEINIQSPPPPNFILPPSKLRGHQIENEFVTQTDLINIISWKAPTSGMVPASYRIYRDPSLTHLIATISGNDDEYADHNRHKNVVYTYFVVSVAGNGKTSVPAVIKVAP